MLGSFNWPAAGSKSFRVGGGDLSENRTEMWRRLGLEFIVIVIGVLAALAVDDWRQTRADRALENHLLSSLRADLEADEIDAKFQEEAEQKLRDAVDHILAVVDHPLAPTNASKDATGNEINASLWLLKHRIELEIADGTYSEMIATGSCKVIRNTALRTQISKYYTDSRSKLRIPARMVDPRPEFLTALASVGVVEGFADQLPDLVERLKSEPLIATHALRIRRYYDGDEIVRDLREKRLSLMSLIDREISRFE
jgi:hypothetical protein